MKSRGRNTRVGLLRAGSMLLLGTALLWTVAPAAADTWSQKTKITGADTANGDQFGIWVSLDSDTAVVGASGNNSSTGAMYVFTGSGSSWSQQAKLVGTNVNAGKDEFGTSVAIDGDTAIAGAPKHIAGSVGTAYVFTRSGATWNQQAKLVASDPAVGAYFGTRVDIEGDTAIVGEGGSSSADAAYVFTRSGATWTEQQKLTDAGGGFGDAVAVEGDYAVVGAQYFNGNDGYARVFRRSAGTWTNQTQLTSSDEAGDYFGVSVDISGDTVAVGAFFANSIKGAVYVFTRSGETWSQQQKITASDGVAADFFGYRVALQNDTLVVGAHNSDPSGDSSGSVYVFTRSGGTWTEEQKLTTSDGVASDMFGVGVAISGATILGGASGVTGGANAGAAYIFALPPAGSLVVIQ